MQNTSFKLINIKVRNKIIKSEKNEAYKYFKSKIYK
jgi:hypothetical protein